MIFLLYWLYRLLHHSSVQHVSGSTLISNMCRRSSYLLLVLWCYQRSIFWTKHSAFFNVSITLSCHCKVLRCISCMCGYTYSFLPATGLLGLLYHLLFTLRSISFLYQLFSSCYFIFDYHAPWLLESCDCCTIPPSLLVHLIICFSSMGSVYMLATFLICAHKWILHNLWVGSCFNLCI